MKTTDIQNAQGVIKRVVAMRLRPGMDVMGGLEEVCIANGISNGVILSALGSLADVYYCNPIELPDKKAGYGYGDPLHLDGPIELLSATGIICHDDEGVTNLHVHVTLSDRNGNAYGGHLVEGTKVLLTTDVVVAEIEGINMGRKMDPDLEVPIFTPTQK